MIILRFQSTFKFFIYIFLLNVLELVIYINISGRPSRRITRFMEMEYFRDSVQFRTVVWYRGIFKDSVRNPYA
jgi:hypothetical protein